MSLPNILHESVPIGKDDSENLELRRVGTPRTFDFPSRTTVNWLSNVAGRILRGLHGHRVQVSIT